MKEEINKNEIQNFNRDGAIFGFLLVVLIVSAVPLSAFFGYYGLTITSVIFVIAMYFAKKLEKFKKSNNIQRFKEILLFTDGKRLDEIEKTQEYGKRPYQKFIYALAAAVIGFVVSILFVLLLKSSIF